MKIALTVASLFALAFVYLFAYALFTIGARQDEVDEIVSKGENDGR